MPDDEIGALERDEGALRPTGRRIVGVTGRVARIPFRDALEASGLGWYPLCALWALGLADAAAGAAIVSVSPQASLSGIGGLGLFGTLRIAELAAGGVGALFLLQRRANRAVLARWAALVAAVGVVGMAMATAGAAAAAAAALTAVAAGVMAAVSLPLLFDTCRAEIRMRAVGGYAAAWILGLGGAALIVQASLGMGLTWRSALLVLAVAPLAAAVLALRLDDAPVGGRDRARIGRLVEASLGGPGTGVGELGEHDVALTMGERFRRATAPASARALLTMAALFGAFASGFGGGLDPYLRDRWGMVQSSRSLLLAVLALATTPGVLWFAARGEVAFRRSPRRLMRLTVALAVVAGVALALAAVAPSFALAVLLLWVSFTAFATLLVAAAFLLLTLVDPAVRGQAAVLVGLAVLAGGVFIPQLAVRSVATRFGIEWGLVVAAFTTVLLAAGLRAAVATVEGDVDAFVDRAVEAYELSTRVAQGHHLPLLSCRHLDFAYGQVQVLFDVSLTVDDGEMVALLGTNGAGKSTLLRLVSGLSSPSAGSIHFRGADVTYLGTNRRVEVGISQIPGGRAVFTPLTVADNLKAYGHSRGHDRAGLDRAIDDVFAALPRLGERRNQQASTLSGGEQQMLALGKALILQPRLLLIDELSLGLAPIVVGDLLEMVQRINAAGTAVILVEQSVNVALSVVDHAYFMEKGEMRFDGAAGELLGRPDLLRSVFLQGATKGIAVGGAA